MILTERFAFIHVPKTGGQFVASVLRKCKSLRHCRIPRTAHTPISSIPTDMPAFAFVREPASWYVSWYDHCMRLPEVDPVFDVLSRGRTLTPDKTISSAAAPTTAMLEQIVSRLSTLRRHHFHMPIDRALVSEWRVMGEVGLYSYITTKMLTRNWHDFVAGAVPDRSGLTLYDFAELRPALARELRRHGVDDADHLVDPTVSPPVNIDVAPTVICGSVLELISQQDARLMMALEATK